MIVAILTVAIAPQVILFAWTQVDRKASGLVWGAVRDAAEETARIEGTVSDPDDRERELEGVALRRKARVRVFDANGARLVEVDHEEASGAFDRVEAFFLGTPSPPSRADLDAELGPPTTRAFSRDSRGDLPNVSCDFHDGLLVCEAALHVVSARGVEEIVLTEASTRRAVQMVYALRYQLLRLGLVTLPFAVLLAFYMGRRVVRPLDQLRHQALAQSSRASRNVALTYRDSDGDEVADLARAFNELLGALEAQRHENEAFIADLVHELKNPVAAIRAGADSVESQLTPDRAARVARVLRDSTGKMDRLVTQFLELARAEAGMPEEPREPLDIVPLVRGLVASADDDERHRDVRFTITVPQPDSPIVVVGVDHRLEGAFRELLQNAASFSSGGEVRADITTTATEVTLAVSDDGPGIAPENLPRVFDRFFTTRAGAASGTGLGLALVRAVAEAHGGSVAASSEVGTGARISLVLPLAPRL